MKSDAEMTRDILKAAKVQRELQKKRRTVLTSAAAAVVIVLAGVGAWRVVSLQPAARGETTPATTRPAIEIQETELAPDGAGSSTSAPSPAIGNSFQTTSPTYSAEDPPETVVGTTANLTTSEAVVGGNANVMIPAVPADKTIYRTGEQLTDAMARAYFEEHLASIASELSASGVAAERLRISETGYCHVRYDGTLGERLEVRQNFRDYLAYNGDALAAIITLTLENGKIYATPSFGAPWFKEFNDCLNRHKGEALVFVYAGWMELMITPENEVINPMGNNVALYLDGYNHPYQMFACPEATYVP